jgi:hypothetical protein
MGLRTTHGTTGAALRGITKGTAAEHKGMCVLEYMDHHLKASLADRSCRCFRNVRTKPRKNTEMENQRLMKSLCDKMKRTDPEILPSMNKKENADSTIRWELAH